ncbi:isoaspartyl peptidase/L-asparaginase family protein [Pseudogulbenkiania subflava]|uniref:Isoaspartyl peptidase n=1 Tax=Pseudogulbenkiania subflava DSM 22618 TaxID=1123014 RepID=A0A1Y6C2N6_9NEIS|nr:isoaspartyl peptidase/L-asparaginase [Pseudogulbenkiania subflava]SMF38752.1 beta-aspartyl-peptidase (threonine type) [Pseudogulbenkiania subflava DSM 22618]
MTIAFAVHGGAGPVQNAERDPERDTALRAGLAAALDAGYRILHEGGSALDAVTTAVALLEDDPLFNAGRGADFTLDGRVELEAAVMDGHSRAAGAVTGVSIARNPVRLARRVMEATPCVMLGFAAADAFARTEGLECEPPQYFFTEARWQALQREKARLADGPAGAGHGTVGAVALDVQGRLAAATSTGGRAGKWPGRIGDSPLIGAGTWADERCAVSATGHGEYFIRAAVAHDIAARLAYAGQTLAEAADSVVHGTLPALGGSGGVIAVDADGRVAMPFNSAGMYRAMIDGTGRRELALYRDDAPPP